MIVGIKERDLMHSGLTRPLSNLIATNKTYTWDNKPSAADYGVGQVWISDLNAMYYSDGISWILVNTSIADAPTCIIVGNSISKSWQTADSDLPIHPTGRAEHLIANALAGDIFVVPVMEESSGGAGAVDSFAVYGYSGATLNSMLDAGISDGFIKAFNQFDKANAIPNLVYAAALFENDIAGGRTENQIVTDIIIFLKTFRTKYPGVMFLIGCPRPSLSYNTNEKKIVYTNITNYLLNLSDSDVYVYETSDFVDPNIAGNPITTKVIGSISGTTLTVTAFNSGVPIEIGDYIVDSSHYVEEYISGTGYAGTYKVTTGLSNSGALTLYPYTDTSVHPTTKATMQYARNAAAEIKKIFGHRKRMPGIVQGAIVQMTGSITATGTNVTGTVPTNFNNITGRSACNTLCEVVSQGVRITYSNITDSVTPTELAQFNTNYTYPTPVGIIKAFVKFRIISGGQYIRAAVLRYRLTNAGVDSGAIDWLGTLNTSGSNTNHGHRFVDGDELFFKTQPIRATGLTGGMITDHNLYFMIVAKEHVPAGANIVIEISDIGTDVIKYLSGRATLTGGQVTIPAGERVTSKSIIAVDRVTPNGTPGALFVSAKTVGTSFVISSTNAADTSLVSWEIKNI